jgi:hypothetical protein
MDGKKLDLGRAIHRGRAAGARLAAGVNPTFFASQSQVEDGIALLAQAEARYRDDLQLWEREWIAIAIRGARLAATRRDDADAIRARCEALEAKITALDDRAFAAARARLADGTYRPDDLASDLAGRPKVEWDAFVKRLFQIDLVPPTETDKPAGMVQYLPSPMSAIDELAKMLGPSDVLYDIGSGLGLVTILVAWLSGAKCRGIEREPAYHRAATEHAARFPKLPVELFLGDARSVDYSEATAIYIYDAIRGQLLAELLDRFLPIPRPFVLISRGQSTPEITARGWRLERDTPSGLSLFRKPDAIR